MEEIGRLAEEENRSPYNSSLMARLSRAITGRRYMHFRPRVLAGASLVTSALLIFATASVSYFTLRRMQTSFEWVKHTQRVLLEVGHIQTNIFAVVAAERSYMLTKHLDRLEDLNQIATEVGAQLRDVDELTRDNPNQFERLALLRGLIEQWLVRLRAELDSVAAKQAEVGEADELARAGQRSINNALQQVVNVEVGLLDRREAQEQWVATVSNNLGTLTLLLGLLTAGLGVWLIQSQRGEARIRNMHTKFIESARDTVIVETAVTVAHEVSQPLTATKNYLAVARRMIDRDTPEASRQTNALNLAIIQVDRATDILRHLRGFGAQAELGRSVVSIRSLIEDIIEVSGLDWSGTKLIQQIPPDLPNCLVNPVHIQQVLVNLARNGLEAMARSSRRQMIIAAELAAPAIIRVSVRDTGPGLPTDVLDRLFRPFVTTKEGGMGVGLSICRRIVEAYGGQISARNSDAGGAVFEFTLPAVAST